MPIRNIQERDKLIRGESDSANKFLIFAAKIIAIALLFIVGWSIVSNAQTITKNYEKGLRIRIDGNTSEKKPCMVFFCGGGFMTQNWEICNVWSSLAVENGFVSCRVGYSVSFPSDAAAKKGISNCMSAVRWVKLHANEYNIDTNKIYLAGTSAGGFCAMGVYMKDSDFGSYLDRNNQGATNKVVAVLNGWGGVLKLDYLSNSNIPIYNVSTDIDKTVPVGCGNAFGVSCCGSSAINNELTARGVKTDWLVWEKYKHGLLPKDSGYNTRVRESFLFYLYFIKLIK